MELPIITDNDDMAEHGVSLVAEAVRRMGHIFRPAGNRDVGIDGQIEVVTRSGVHRRATGRLIGVQIKCGPSYFKNDLRHAWAHYCSAAHANYWAGYSLPVILVLCDPNSAECYWVEVDSTSIVPTPEGAKIIVPKTKKLGTSGAAIAAVARSGKLETKPPHIQSFVFPLDGQYRLNLDDEELGVLCGEVSLALKQNEDAAVEVSFAVEAVIANEADVIRLSPARSVEQRKRLVELQAMVETLSVVRARLMRGIRILLGEDYIREGYIDLMDYAAASRAVRGFVHYYLFERLGRRGAIGLTLDAFPGDGSSGLVAKIFLDEQQRHELLHRLGTNGSTAPLMWPGYVLGELGRDLLLDHGLPAVVTSLLFHLDRNRMSEREFFSADVEPLYAWRLGLA